jgi:peptidoglycan/LPS O-acetylase OafA/YrhL
MPDQFPSANMSGGRKPVLDGIRGVATRLVMMFHFWLFRTETGTTLWKRVYSTAAGTLWAAEG